MKKLTHFDDVGQAHMVNVGEKAETHRVAKARGSIRMLPATLKLILDGDAKKGDVLGIARVAAIQASKRTSDLIPLCHPISLTKVGVEFEIDKAKNTVHCTVTAETVGRTGVEMEALTATSVALLTIYDMCKAVDRGMVMGEIKLLEKMGGKSGHWVADVADKFQFKWSNPDGIDLTKPYIYFIRVHSGKKEYRYIGKGSNPSRMDAYARNVSRVLAGKPRRPALKRNGEPQSEENIKFRYVHLVLAVALREGWEIEHSVLENCEKSRHAEIENIRKRERNCNMNDGPSWFVRDFERLAKDIG